MTGGPWFHGRPDPRPDAQPEASDGADSVHISVVLDRSGSMSSIADDVVGGFNEFLADQRSGAGAARMTLAQFDSHEPFEVLIDGVDLRRVADLSRSAYQPRGSTPLYDAVGRMIGRIDADIARRTRAGRAAADQVVVVVTDGMENASREHTRSSVFDLIEARRRAGWVFVFLGANQDAYAAGGRMAVARGNRANWEASPKGSRKMWRDLSHSSHRHRAKAKAQRHRDRDAFYEEDPAGE